MHHFTSFQGKNIGSARTKIFFLLFGLSLLAFVKPLNYGIETPVAVEPYLNGVFEPVLAEPGADDSWQVEVAFPNVTFIDPLELVELPGTNKLVIVGKTGFVWTIDNDPSTSQKTVFLDISAKTKTGIDSGLMGIAFHPDFGKAGSPNRGYFYVMYRYRFEAGYGGKEGYIRVSRYTVPDGSNVADEASELVLIQQYERHEFHLGGGMCFDNEGFLFISFGDEGDARDSFNSSQKINEGFFSGVLRIDVDMDASRSHPIRRQPQNPANPPRNSWPDSFSANYYVPNDNPWVNANGSVLEEFYAIGLRNVFKMTYDAEADQIWGGEVGQGRREEVVVIEKGANYEWSYKEGNLTGFRSKPGNLIGTETDPYFQYPHSQGACIIGGFVYRGTKWPSLRGKYIFGDHVYRDIYTIPSDANSEPDEELLLTMERDGVGSKTGITSFGTDASGEIYVLNAFESDEDGGKIYKLTRDGETTFNPPTLLSQTNAFKNLETLEPADELIPYKVNSPLWSDGAAKKRWIVIPNDGTFNSSDEQVIFDENDEWDFPVGTVFIKHFELPLDQRNPSVTRKLETRFVILGPDNWVGGITYKWNEAGTDATLLETGDSQAFTVIDEEGNPFNQIWDFPSRGQCLTCHNTNAKSVLGLKTHQLNGDLTYPSTGITDNQLRTWNSLGIFANGPLESNIPNLPKSVPIDDPHASLDLKVSSYLDANCSHCHRPGGVITSFDARFQSELDKLIYAPTQSTASAEGSQIVIPGDALNSMLRIRDAAEEEGAMPPLARNIVDQVYIDTLTAWINRLNPDDYEIPCTEPTIDRLVWVNSDTDEIIGEVPNGGLINMYGRNHNINIVAVVDDCPETVGSVKFSLNGPTTLNRGESVAPYVLAGDNAGDYNRWNYQLGAYTLVATPYSEKGAKGTVGTPVSVSFEIVVEDSDPCEEDPPSVEAGENVLLACDGTPSQVTATANEAGSFSWSGPNGFSANTASISITTPGTYTVLFTDLDNCTTSDQLSAALESPATVSIDQLSAAICEGKSIDLSATANGNGSFSWSGPNEFSATGATITASEAGTYTLTFTNDAGCTASDAITVDDLGTPTVSIAQQSPVLCEGSLLTLTISNPDAEGSYSWIGPNTFTAEGASVEISEAGIYTVTYFSAAGCEATDEVTVTEEALPQVNVANELVSICEGESVNLSATSTQTGTYSWTGPNDYSANGASITVSVAGTYTVSFTNENGCENTDQSVVEYLPTASVSAGNDQVLACTGPGVTLSASANGPGDFSWTGPNNFTASTAEIIVAAVGTYSVSYTNASGCEAIDVVNVIPAPLPVVDAGDDISPFCDELPVSLSPSLGSNGLDVLWSGPNDFSSIESNPQVTEAGIYTITVTNEFGCSSSDQLTVFPCEEQPSCEEPKVGTLMLVNANTDQDLIEIVDGSIINLQLFPNPLNINAIPEDCPTTMVRSVRFFLEGPIDITKTESVAPYALGGDNRGNYNPITFPTGTYTLRTIAYSEKGTKGTAGTPVDISFTIVDEDPDPCADGTPTIDAGENVVLSCNEASTLLSASASEGGSFSWTGPNGFTSNNSSISVNQAGTYTVDFTNVNGCTVSDAVEVSRPTYDPVSSIPSTVSISCEAGQAPIKVVASDYDSFSWTGPNGFTSDMLSPDVSMAGTYTITFQKGIGCSASYSVTASLLDTYDPISSIPSQISLNCEQTEGVISVVAEPYTTVSWSGPNGFSSSNLSPTVSEEGTYILSLTYGASCVETASVLVVKETSGFNPFVSFPTNVTLPCDSEGVSIPVSLSDYDSYSWAGPEGFSSTDISPLVSIPGTYTLTVNSVGGCSVSRSVTVDLGAYDPVSSIPAIVELDCITGNASITTEITAYTSLQWTGPGNFQSSEEDIEVSVEGVYTLTVSSLAGCAQQYEVLVEGCPDECEESTVASLIIVNADTDQDVMEIQDGGVYNLNDFGHNIAIRAEEDACTFDVKSVRMVLSGAQDFSRTESKAPWALFGDSRGDFSPWIAKPGSYTLIATPYSEKGAKGTAGPSKEVSFSFTNPQSNFQSFRVLNELLKEGETQVYVAPNRASKLTYIYLEGEETGLVDVEVINILGAKTHDFQANKDSFKSQHTLELSNLTEGMYWVRVKFAQREYVRKLLIEK